MMEIEKRKPSEELLSLIKAAASSLVGFAELWDSIRLKGADEGFSEQELRWFLKPMLQEKFQLSEGQVRYLFNKENEIKRSRDNRQKTKEELEMLRTYHKIPPKKEPDKSDTSPNITAEADEKSSADDESDEKDWEKEYNKDMAKAEALIREMSPESEREGEGEDQKPVTGFAAESKNVSTMEWRIGLKDPEFALSRIKSELIKYKGWGWTAIKLTVEAL